MKNFFKSTMDILTIYAILFISSAVLANWFVAAEYSFVVVLALGIVFVIIGLYHGIKNTINDKNQPGI